VNSGIVFRGEMRMSMHVDHKGKYFTDVISKDVIRTVIQTMTVRIIGDIYVRIGERFKDEFNKTERFIAVTDAEVINARGETIYCCDFMTVNLDNVLWMSPEENAKSKTPES
jgi:hypothetical protein